MAINLACIHCNNVKVKLLEEKYNDVNNYITRYYECPNCKKIFEAFELSLNSELNEFRCLLCGKMSLSTSTSDRNYCSKCEKIIENTKKAIRENNDEINKGLEEHKLDILNKKIFENVKKYRGNFFPVTDFDKMTHYIYSFMKPTHPKKPVKDTTLSQKVLRKYFDNGSIIGFVQLKEGFYKKSNLKPNIIKELREKNNYSKEKFSKLIGISITTLTNYENDKNLDIIPLKTITKLSSLYNISTDEIAFNLENRMMV